MEGMKPHLLHVGRVFGAWAALSVPLLAQEPQSAAPARELAQLMSEKKIDSIATRLPGRADEFAGALVFSSQIVVVWARYSVPSVLNEKLLKREYREVYIDLNSASIAETRNFVTDIGSDGIRRGQRDQPADTHDIGNKSMRFDGNWREDKMSEADYMKAYADADAAYAKVLAVLIEQAKKVG
jgi:hypothetical protein